MVVAVRKRRPKHRWTEAEIEAVRSEYDGSLRVAERLAHRFGTGVAAVRREATLIGVSRSAPRWKPEQLEQLEELAARLTVPQIARRFRRSQKAVQMKLLRLGISARNRDGWYSQGEVCGILGVDRKWVGRHIASKELPAQFDGLQYRIQEADLRQFIRGHAHELQGRNVDLLAVVDLLAGILTPTP